MNSSCGLDRGVSIDCGNGSNGVPAVEHLVAGHDVFRLVCQGDGSGRASVFVDTREILASDDCEHTGHRKGSSWVDGPDHGVGVWAPNNLAPKLTWQADVSTVDRAAGYLVEAIMANGTRAYYREYSA